MIKGISKKLITSLFIVTILFSCSRENGRKERGTAQPPAFQPTPVDVYRVPPPADLPVELKYPARTRSVGSVTIVARVSGTLQKMFFKEGEVVKKGDRLFKIEPVTYQASLDSAKAQLQEAIANLNKADRDWKRVKASYSDGVVSEKERDATLSAYELAKASVDVARARLRRAEIDLAYTDVIATITGRTGMKLIDTGNLVTPGTPLVTITKIDPIYAEFSFPDIDIINTRYRLSSGSWKALGERLKASLIIDDRLYKRDGYIDFIDTNVDVDTSSVKARAVFPNPEGELLPGQFVRIIIKGLLRKNAIEVPQEAVVQTPVGASVFVVDGGKAVARPVEIGEQYGKNFIVEKGLKSGDMVIVSNLIKVRPDSPVKVSNIINEKK